MFEAFIVDLKQIKAYKNTEVYAIHTLEIFYLSKADQKPVYSSILNVCMSHWRHHVDLNIKKVL